MRFSGFFIVLPALALVTCRKQSDDYSQVKIIGHAGAGLEISTSPYHDNSHESVFYALNLEGVSGVEVDLQCSADGTGWLFHDLQLKDETNGEGCVNSASDSYLSGLHYTTLEKEALVRLDQLAFPFDKRTLFIDIRTYNECTETTLDQQTVINAIHNALPGIAATNIHVITVKPEWVSAFHAQGWNVYLETLTPDAYLSDSNLSQTVGICIRNADISQAEVAGIQSTGKEVMLFDARSPKGIRSALQKFPDYLLADDIRATLIEQYP